MGRQVPDVKSINIIKSVLKDGKTHIRTKVSEKMYKIQKYMTMHDKIKSDRVGEYKYDTEE